MSTRILDFMSYAEFLLTPGWLETRKTAIARAGGKCAICGKAMPLMNVHHRNYLRVGEELPADLVVLCGLCHQEYELGREVLAGAPARSAIVPMVSPGEERAAG